MDDHSSGTSVAGRLARPTRAAAAETRLAGAGPEGPVGRPPLCGLAPGGVCHAAPVSGSAVRSYRTLSPLPPVLRRGATAVCSLWHFPWGRPRRVLPGTVFPWSPDFPPPSKLGSGHPAASRPLLTWARTPSEQAALVANERRHRENAAHRARVQSAVDPPRPKSSLK